jgi:hypothetical protein
MDPLCHELGCPTWDVQQGFGGPGKIESTQGFNALCSTVWDSPFSGCKKHLYESRSILDVVLVLCCSRLFTDPMLLQVFFDVRVDNEPKGRITIQLFNDVPIGAQRFLELAEGKDGVSYRLSKIDGISPVCKA